MATDNKTFKKFCDRFVSVSNGIRDLRAMALLDMDASRETLRKFDQAAILVHEGWDEACDSENGGGVK